MSDPMSVVEIEDVLSSIRRLVSEDLRPTHKLVSAALKNGAAKLILTPALRVVTNEAPGFVHTADALDDPRDLQSVLDGIEATDADEAIEVLPMFGSVRMQEMADIRPDLVDPEKTDANFLASAMSRINGLATAEPGRAAPLETIEEVVAAVGAAVGPEEWEVDGGEPAPQAAAWQDTNWTSVDPVEVAAEETAVAAVLVLSTPVVAADTDPADAAGQIAETSADAADFAMPVAPADNAGQSHDQQGADQPAPDLLGQDSIVFHDEYSAQSQIETANTAPEAEALDHADQDADDAATYLNEDLLRDIVRDMIHAELQGTLGERITRNVRKLVRSEINRALAARDYE